jgi:hypothetical protein
MFCPYLGKDLSDEVTTLEHVVPYSIGGSNAFTIHVSKTANDRAGGEVDSLLTNNFFISAERIARGLEGQSGNAPSYRWNGTIDVDGRAVDARYKISSEQQDLWMRPDVQRALRPDGIEQVSIACELADLDRILADLNRKLAKQGKAPIDKDAFIRNARLISNDQPEMKVEDSFNVHSFERPFIKIALGAAHYALGETFTRTADADLLRCALWEPDPTAVSRQGLHGCVWPLFEGTDTEQFLKIMGRPDQHVVVIANTGPLGAAIILFGQYLGMLKLSDNVRRYAPQIGEGVAYVIDPITRTLDKSTYREHVARYRPAPVTLPST